MTDESLMNSSSKVRIASFSDLPPETRDNIGHATGDFTVALHAVDESRGGNPLRFCGSATLVAVEGANYILTAAHVWETLGSAERIGVSIKEYSRYLFLMKTKTIARFGPQRLERGEEWGPDLCFLRIPSEYVGSIKACRTFYNLAKERHPPPGSDTLETWVLMGAAEADGTITKTHTRLRISANFFRESGTVRERDGFDYLDMGVNLSLPGVPKSFGGVSGGGWRVFWSPPAGKLVPVLKGVAFYESLPTSGLGFIRCHTSSFRTPL
jgi:hypothetical protein